MLFVRQRKYIEPARNGIIAFDACNLQKAVVSLAGAFTLRARDGDIVSRCRHPLWRREADQQSADANRIAPKRSSHADIRRAQGAELEHPWRMERFVLAQFQR